MIENEKYDEKKKITDDFDYLNSSLLISKEKKWIEDKKFKNFLDKKSDWKVSINKQGNILTKMIRRSVMTLKTYLILSAVKK